MSYTAHGVDPGLKQQGKKPAGKRNWTKIALIVGAFVTMAAVIMAAGVFLMNSLGNHAAPAPVTTTNPAASLTYQASPPTSSAPAVSYTPPDTNPGLDPQITNQLRQFQALSPTFVESGGGNGPAGNLSDVVEDRLIWAANGGNNTASPWYFGVCERPLQSDSACQLLSQHGGLNMPTTLVGGINNNAVPDDSQLTAQAIQILLSFKDGSSEKCSMLLERQVPSTPNNPSWWFIKEINVVP